MKALKLITVMFVVVLFGVSNLFAGVVIVNRVESKTMGKTATMKYMFDKNGFRMESGEEMGPDLVIFNRDKEVLWLVDTGKGTYTEITRQDLEKMNAMIEQHMKMFEEQMKNVPPDHRKMMEKYMSKMMGKGNETKTDFQKVASGVKMKQWICDQYEGKRGDEKISDVWTTDWKKLGITEEDMSVMQEFSDYFESLRSKQEKIGGFNFSFGGDDEEGKLPGVPVKTVYYQNGQVETVTELVEIKKQDLDKGMFSLPSGLQKEASPFQKIPQGMPGGY